MQPHSPDNRALARECKDIKIDRVYIGSCTGGKTEDFLAAAKVFLASVRIIYYHFSSFSVLETERDKEIQHYSIKHHLLYENQYVLFCTIAVTFFTLLLQVGNCFEW